MRIYLRSDPEAATYLRSLLDTRGWLSKSKREFAHLASSVLAEAGDAKALEILRAASADIWTSPKLRDAYASTLRFYKGERATVDEEQP